MGCCNFTSKNGVICSCISGSYITLSIDKDRREEYCDKYGHQISLHCNYSKNFALQSIVFYWYLFIVPLSSLFHLPRDLVIALRFQEISPQTKTVEELVQLLEAYRVIYIRRTSSSGKTTLAFFLLNHYKHHDKSVVLIDGWYNISNSIIHQVEQSIFAGYVKVIPINLYILNIVFLFDEA